MATLPSTSRSLTKTRHSSLGCRSRLLLKMWVTRRSSMVESTASSWKSQCKIKFGRISETPWSFSNNRPITNFRKWTSMSLVAQMQLSFQMIHVNRQRPWINTVWPWSRARTWLRIYWSRPEVHPSNHETSKFRIRCKISKTMVRVSSMWQRRWMQPATLNGPMQTPHKFGNKWDSHFNQCRQRWLHRTRATSNLWKHSRSTTFHYLFNPDKIC